MISYYFPPLGKGGTFRSLKFAKYLPTFGWKPLVLTVSEKFNWQKDYSLLDQLPEDVKIYRTKAPHPRKFFKILSKVKLGRIGSMIARTFFFPDPEILWFPFAIGQAGKIFRKNSYSIVYSSSGPVTSHLIAYYLKRKFGIKWIADLRDAMFEDDKFWYRKHYTIFHKYLAHKVEKWVYKEADHVIANTELNYKRIQDRWHLPKEKISYIPNGFDEEDYRKNKSVIRKNGKFQISYIGDFYGGDFSPYIILEALQQIKEKNYKIYKNIEFNIIGSSNHSSLVEKMQLDDVVRDRGYVNYNESIDWIRNSNLLIAFLPDRNMDYCVPQKIYQYLRSGNPILGIMNEGCASEILRKSGLGIIVKHRADEIAEMITKIYSDNLKNKIKPNWSYINQYERRHQTEKLVNVLNNLVKK